MVRFGKVAVDHVQLALIQRGLDSIDVLVVGIGQIALVVALQIIPDAGVLPAVAAGAEGHLDVVVRNVPHREEGVAAGIDGGIAPVLGPGVDAQQGHGTLGGFCTVGLHGRFMIGLFKIIGAAGAGGETDDVADLILKGAYIGDDTFVLRGGRCGQRGGAAGYAQGQCQAEGKGAEQLFHGVTSKEKKFRSRIDDFWGAVKKKISAAFTPGAGCVKM